MRALGKIGNILKKPMLGKLRFDYYKLDNVGPVVKSAPRKTIITALSREVATNKPFRDFVIQTRKNGYNYIGFITRNNKPYIVGTLIPHGKMHIKISDIKGKYYFY